MTSFKRIIQKSKHKSFDEYINDKKWDIIIRVIIFILIIPLIIYFIPSFDFQLMIYAIFVFILIDYLHVYNYYIDIKKYVINNNLIDRIGNILFSNNLNYFLTDNYIIIIKENMINCFEYSEIIKLYKTRKINWGRMSSYSEQLHIVTLDREYSITIYSTSNSIVNEDQYDISEFLLEKNPNIIEEGFIKKEGKNMNNKYNILSIIQFAVFIITAVLVFIFIPKKSNSSFICKLENNGESIELQYDYNSNNEIYKYTIITVNKKNKDFDYDKLIESVNLVSDKYKGLSSKVWFDDNTYTTIETFYLDYLSNKETKLLTGYEKEKLKKLSRKEIKESIIPMSNGGKFSCN